MNKYMLVVVGFCCCLSLLAQEKAGASRPMVEKTPALEMTRVQGECASTPDADKCQAQKLLAAAQIHIQGALAQVAMGTIDVEYLHKPRSMVGKEVVAARASIQKDAVPLLDHVESLKLSPSVLQSIKTYRAMAMSCATKMDFQKTEQEDAYTDRMNSCEVPVQKQLNGIYVSLGYPVDKPFLGFRKSQWGDSVAQVQAIEGKPLLSRPDALTYQTKVDGHDAYAVFIFIDGKLVKSGYSFSEKHSNNNAYIDDYDSISEALTAKYGKSITHGANWENPLFKNDRSHSNRRERVALSKLRKPVRPKSLATRCPMVRGKARRRLAPSHLPLG